MENHFAKCLVFFIFVTQLNKPVFSQELFGLHLVNNSYQIVKYNQNIATFETIINIPNSFGALWSLTYDPTSDFFYTFGNAAYSQPSSLIRIHRCTHEITNLGNINLQSVNGGIIQNNICVTDGLSFDPNSQLLYATINSQCNNPDANRIVSFDLTGPTNPIPCTEVASIQDPLIDLDLIAVTNVLSGQSNIHGVDASPQTANTHLYHSNLVNPNIGFTDLIQTYTPWSALRGLAFNEQNDLLYSFAGQQGNAWLRTIVPNYLPNAGAVSNVAQFNLTGIQIRGLSFGLADCSQLCVDYLVSIDCINFNLSTNQYEVNFSVGNSNQATATSVLPFNVLFFDGNPALGGVQIGSQAISSPLNVNESISNLSISFDNNFVSSSGIFAVINLANNYTPGIPISNSNFNHEECDYANNIASSELPIVQSIQETICAGQTISFHGQTFATTGNHQLLLQNQNGCDSIVFNLELSVLQNVFYDSVNIESCNQFEWFGLMYSSSGQYEHLIVGTQCDDSLFVLNLTISQELIENSISSCDSIFFQNTWFYNNALVVDSFPSSNPLCDSIVHTQILVFNSTFDTLIVQDCNSYVFENQTIFSSGVYDLVGQNQQGCIHNLHLNLNIVESYSTTQFDTICGQTIWGNQTITQSGIYEQNFTTQFDCDSLVSLYIVVNPVHETIENRYTCDPNDLQSESFYFTNSFGCDSVKIIQPLLYPQHLRPLAAFSVTPNPVDIEAIEALSILNLSSNALYYNWQIPAIDFTSNAFTPSGYNFDETGEYAIYLTVSDDYACVDSIAVLLFVEEDILVYVPNTFTPDDDLHNNIFLPVFSGPLDIYNYELLIFNRWGEVIFESRNPAVGWDGTYGGTIPVQDGTYIWKIKFKSFGRAHRRELIGHVNVLR